MPLTAGCKGISRLTAESRSAYSLAGPTQRRCARPWPGLLLLLRPCPYLPCEAGQDWQRSPYRRRCRRGCDWNDV